MCAGVQASDAWLRCSAPAIQLASQPAAHCATGDAGGRLLPNAPVLLDCQYFDTIPFKVTIR
eukprot:COSAG01_NODE_3437_length_6098_cov_5.799800_6_plen_62_part_00